MMRGSLFALVVVLLTGCAAFPPRSTLVFAPGAPVDATTEQRARAALSELFPRPARLTHRAILAAWGRQFPCDGYLQLQPQTGLRLAVLSPMGVITELQMAGAGQVTVTRTGASFREAWTRKYVARDVRLLFAPDVAKLQAGRLADGRLVLWQSLPEESRLAYVFNPNGATLQELEISTHRARLYHVTCRRYNSFPGSERAVPTEMYIDAGLYTLELRVLELRGAR